MRKGEKQGGETCGGALFIVLLVLKAPPTVV